MDAVKIPAVVCLAVFLQILLTRHLEYFYFLDLPLVAVIYFATYKPRFSSALIGSAAGLVQDSISGLPLGMNGFTKTLAGYTASALAGRLVLETFMMQFLLIAVVSTGDSLVKAALLWAFDLPLTARFLPHSLLQAFVTGAVGAALLVLVGVLEKRKAH